MGYEAATLAADEVRRAGFVDVRDTDLSFDIVKCIEARAPLPEP